MVQFTSVIEQGREEPPNNACSGQLGVCAFFSFFLALSFFRFDGESRPAHLPLMPAVDCNSMCYMSKSSEIAKFSRVFDDSSLQKV